MIFEKIAFEALQGIYIEPYYVADKSEKIPQNLVYTFMLELVNMNFILEKSVIDELCKLSKYYAEDFFSRHLALVREYLGAHVKHEPFYPNFPAQVMEASNLELFVNATLHYFSYGTWKPIFIEEKRVELFEDSKMVKLKLISLDDLKEHFIKLLSSKTGIPSMYDGFIKEGIRKDWFDDYKKKFMEIPFRETSCKVAVECLNQGKDIEYFVKTTTDVLRIMAVYSDQQADLKKVIKFKSMKRRHRRTIIKSLENVINIEDVKRHTSIWIRAFHSLHVGEYGGKVHEIASRFRNENNIHTKNTILSQAIEKGETESAVGILKNLPSMFTRYLDKILRDSLNDEFTLLEFNQIVKSVESKVLLQALGHFKGNSKITKRSVFANNRLIIIEPKEDQKTLSNSIAVKVVDIITNALIEKYKSLNHFTSDSKVYIPKQAEKILLPLQLQTASNSNKRSIARGSRLLPDTADLDKNIVRLFIHWIGKDIDLSCVFFKEDLEKSEYINYTNLRESFAVHSGDIVNAPGPDGASEFIDIDIEKALDAGYRYVKADVRVFSGPNFCDHEQCFGGYMMRKEQEEGEIFEPSTVRVKIDLMSESRDINPFMFDLETKELIWLDIPSNPKALCANNVNNNLNQMEETLNACLELPILKVNMKELLELHVEAGSATVVENQEDANFIVGLGEGDLDLYDFATINSSWI